MAALHDAEAADLPSAEDAVEETVPRLSPMTSLPERQLIHKDALEGMSAIEIGRGIVEFAVMQIEGRAGSAPGRRTPDNRAEGGIPGAGINGFRPYVAGLEG